VRLLRTWIFVDIESMVQLLYSHGLATRRPARYARNSRLALITGGINRSTELPDHPPSHIHSALRIRFQWLLDHANAALLLPLNASRNACTVHRHPLEFKGSDVGKVSGYTSSAKTRIVSLSGHLRDWISVFVRVRSGDEQAQATACDLHIRR